MLQAYNYATGATIATAQGMPELMGALGAYKGPMAKAASGQFNCGTSICWPIGKDVEAVFANLQRQVNRFASQGDFAKIPIDTFIGDQMVAAVNAVIRVTASQSEAAKAVAMSPGPAGRIAIAKYALELSNEFKAAADARQLPAGGGAIVGVAAGQKGAVQPPPGSGYIPPTTASKSRAIWWALGIMSLAGIGTIGYMTFKRSKKAPQKRRTARVRAPAFAR